MNLGILGKRALVTAASRGMGRACAHALAEEGCEVFVAARNRDILERACAEISAATGARVTPVVADITTEEGRTAALSACPAPDILINNGDGEPPGDFREWDRTRWHAALDKMMLSPIEMMRLTVDGMMSRGFGRIVNIVSRSVKTPQLELGLSNGARSGLVGFVAGLSRQTIKKGVTINNILPGIVASDAQRDHVQGLVEMEGRPFEAIWAERAKQNPAGRYGEPEEIGALCAYLCSAKAGFMTGQSILIDGGQYPGTY